jgi:DNA-directed RNA polymerase specialized sigma24 family protein
MARQSSNGFDAQEIAEALEVTERTVRRNWERARRLLSVAVKRGPPGSHLSAVSHLGY